MQKHVFVLLLAAAVIDLAVAQDTPKDTLRSPSLAEMSARLDRAEQQLKQLNTPAVTVGGAILSSYSYSRDGLEGKDNNRFGLERSYFTVKGILSESWKVQLTADMFLSIDTAKLAYKGYFVRMKYAFVDYSSGDFSLKFGMIPGPFSSIEEAAWKYRVVSQTPSDKYGYVATADLGTSLTFMLPDKMGEVAGYWTNGTGYAAPETDKFKDFILRANFTPFASDPTFKTLAVAGYIYKGLTNNKTSGGLQKDRFGALISYAYDFASAGFIYNARADGNSPTTSVKGNVLSVFGELKSPWESMKQFSILGRYDIIEPNDAKGGDKSSLLIGGVAYRPTDKLVLVLDYQARYGETSTALGANSGFDGRIFLHMATTF